MLDVKHLNVPNMQEIRKGENTFTPLCVLMTVVSPMSFRNTDRSHFAAANAPFLQNTSQATRITSAMYTEKSLRVESLSTVHTAHSRQTRELWRHMLNYFMCSRCEKTVGIHKERCWERETIRILIEPG